MKGAAVQTGRNEACMLYAHEGANTSSNIHCLLGVQWPQYDDWMAQ